jgi:polysaccharide export outer membrane protein
VKFIICLIVCFGGLFCPVFSVEKTEYVLRSGDVIAIKVVEHAEFSQTTRVRPDGMINYPVLGEIEVAGLTSQQLVKVMEEKLAPYVNNVVVSVGIEQYFSNKIYILGAVGRSGQYEIFEPLDVLKALTVAGGLKNHRIRYVKILRSNGDISVVDLKVALEQKGATQEIPYILYPGDTMFVPEKTMINWGLVATILTVINLSLVISFRFITLG